MAWKISEVDNLAREVGEHRRRASLYTALHRFVIETGKQDEFLGWLAKDMGLDKPFDFAPVDALMDEQESGLRQQALATGTHGQQVGK